MVRASTVQVQREEVETSIKGKLLARETRLQNVCPMTGTKREQEEEEEKKKNKKKKKKKCFSNFTPHPHPLNLSGFSDEVLVFLVLNFRKTHCL